MFPMNGSLPIDALTIRPVAACDWQLVEALFGPERGAYAGCWCQWFRSPRRDFVAMAKPDRKAALRAQCAGRPPAGVVALAADGAADRADGRGGPRAVGWCAVGPRAAYPRLEQGRASPPPDRPGRPDDGAAGAAAAGADPLAGVWSITCYYIDRRWRGRGVMTALTRGAVGLARDSGARLIEAFPRDRAVATSPAATYVGISSVFTPGLQPRGGSDPRPQRLAPGARLSDARRGDRVRRREGPGPLVWLSFPRKRDSGGRRVPAGAGSPLARG
ncbi:MAG: hypothetical protein RLO50_00325 [Azospirillaceae bacterium]